MSPETLPRCALTRWRHLGLRRLALTDPYSADHRYLEQYIFKGRQRRSRWTIGRSAADERDLRQGYTCYYARVMSTDLPLAIDSLRHVTLGDQRRTMNMSAVSFSKRDRDDRAGDYVHDLFATPCSATLLSRPVADRRHRCRRLGRDRSPAPTGALRPLVIRRRGQCGRRPCAERRVLAPIPTDAAPVAHIPAPDAIRASRIGLLFERA